MSNKNFPFSTVFVSICLCILCIGLTFNLDAVEVKKIEVNNYVKFQKGTFEGTSLDNKGGIFIGPEIKNLNGPDREYYLSIDIARNGDTYVGTGHRASVYKINPTGEPTEIFKSEDLDVYAVLAAVNGAVYVATSPDGKLYKTVKDKPGSPKVIFDPEEKFIWDVKQDNSGNLIVAVGNTGGIYRVNDAGNAVKIFTSEDTHIISLQISKTGSILAGSGDGGILYNIDNTKVKVLFDSPFEEIRGISEDKEGNIYFSATRGIQQQDVLNNAEVETFLKKKKEGEEDAPPPEKSILYCRRTDGVVERVWASYTEYIYTVCYDQKTDSVLIGTGNDGRVYRVDKEGNFSIVYESEAAQVFKIAATPKGFTLVTNNTAVITNIEDNLKDKGTYLSEIFDLGIQSQLGRIYWDADTSAATNVSLFVRTGNSNVPDSTWSKWSAPFTDSEKSGINMSDVRYFQVKALLNASTPSASPRLNNFKVYYIQSNLKPRLRKIEIKKPENKKTTAAVTDKTSSSPAVQKNQLSLLWQASDPNEDKLKYNLYLKRTTDRDWVLFKEDVATAVETLDTRLFEDGKYLLKVVADDALSNPPAAAKTAELVSSPFLIDSTAPEIGAFTIQGSRVTFTVTDKTSLLARVLYSYDGKMWFPVFPVDNIADARSENYDFTLTDKKASKYFFIKVIDEFDNSKVFQKEL